MKELYFLLLPFLYKKYQTRESINYAILDKTTGKPAKCFCCDGRAVAAGIVRIGKQKFILPICTEHHRNYMDAHYKRWKVLMPHVFNMNPRFVPRQPLFD